MAGKKAGRRWWAAGLIGVVWAAAFYRAYLNLAIPAFGPADQVMAAKLELILRYVFYPAAIGVAWLFLRRFVKPRRKGSGSERDLRPVSTWGSKAL